MAGAEGAALEPSGLADPAAWPQAGVSGAAPAILAQDATVEEQMAVLLSELVAGADGAAIERWRVRDLTGDAASGQLELSGHVAPAETWLEIAGRELDQLVFRGGTAGQNDRLEVMGFDGRSWSQTHALAIQSRAAIAGYG